MKTKKIRSVLITGGLGFIGFNLTQFFIQNGLEVFVLDSKNENSGYNEFHLLTLKKKGLTIIEETMGNIHKHREILKNVDSVVDLAGLVGHLDSMKNPIADIENNTVEHIRFLENIKGSKISKIVYTSTRQVYGKQEKMPVDENATVKPLDFNGINKYSTESYYSIYSKYLNFDIVILRLSNIYGEGMHIRDKRLSFLGWFMNRVVTNNPIEIFGDGLNVRDLLYVGDLVNTIYNSLVLDVSGIFNVGSDKTYTLKRIAEILVDLNPKSSIIYVPFPDDLKNIDIGSFITDNSKAKNLLKHRENVTIEEGLKKTYEYFQKYKGYYL